jgi:Transposase IS66 family
MPCQQKIPRRGSEWIEPIAKRVGAVVLVTDDADGFKTVADEVGVQHQVCKAHVLRNTETLMERYQPLVARDADGSLKAIGVSPAQAAADLTRLGELVKSRQREQAPELEAMHRRYLQAVPPQEGEHQSLAYRLRLLLTSSLEPVASLDALSPMERTQRGNTRWHQ